MERERLVSLTLWCILGVLAWLAACGGASMSSPSSQQQAPQMFASLPNVNVSVGGIVRITLTVTGTPVPNVGCDVNGAGAEQLSGLVVTYKAPDAVPANGQATIVCTATNAAGSATAFVTAKISASSLQITTSSLPPGMTKNNYLAAFSASGGTSPYNWSVSSGNLAPGLSLSTSGSVSGTPTAAGNYNFAVTVTDSSGQIATANFSAVIGNASGQSGTTVPKAFFGANVFGTCTSGTCDWSASFPLQGGISLGTFGKAPFTTGYHIEPTCDGGTDPSSSCYHWANLDAWVSFAEANGMTLVYDWADPPGWQCGLSSTQSCTTLPSDITYMSNFATALATRYKGKIKYYETGNEVNDPSVWADTCANLVLLHNTIYDATKGVDPNAIVGAPNLAGYESSNGACGGYPAVGGGPSPQIWIQNFLQTRDRNGNLPKVDTIGIHTYQIAEPALNNVAQRFLTVYNQFRTVMTNAGIPSNVPLLVTEGSFGPVSNGNCIASLSSTACLTTAQQVAYVGRWLVLGASTWADGGGQLPSWYSYDSDWGTLNGTNGMNPQNASAYGQMESWLQGATFQQPCHTGNPTTVFVCDFVNAQGQQHEIIFNNNNSATATYTTPAWATTYQPLLGNAQAIGGGTVIVGDLPILLTP